MIITLIEVPVFFFAACFLIDGLIVLCDPTVEGAVATNLGNLYNSVKDSLSSIQVEEGTLPFAISISGIMLQTILEGFSALLFFLLCGICFKNNKTITGIAILIGVSIVVSILSGIVITSGMLSGYFERVFDPANPERAIAFMKHAVNASLIINALTAAGLAGGIYYRLKTLKH